MLCCVVPCRAVPCSGVTCSGVTCSGVKMFVVLCCVAEWRGVMWRVVLEILLPEKRVDLADFHLAVSNPRLLLDQVVGVLAG